MTATKGERTGRSRGRGPKQSSSEVGRRLPRASRSSTLIVTGVRSELQIPMSKFRTPIIAAAVAICALLCVSAYAYASSPIIGSSSATAVAPGALPGPPLPTVALPYWGAASASPPAITVPPSMPGVANHAGTCTFAGPSPYVFFSCSGTQISAGQSYQISGFIVNTNQASGVVPFPTVTFTSSWGLFCSVGNTFAGNGMPDTIPLGPSGSVAWSCAVSAPGFPSTSDTFTATITP